MLQIQSFIQSLGLENAPSVRESQKPSSAATEKNKVKNEAIKGHKEAKTTVREGAESPDKVDKKKRKKKEGEVHVAKAAASCGSGEPQIDEGVTRQLHHLSAKSYKKLLISMDSEEMWYDQVSNVYCNIPI